MTEPTPEQARHQMASGLLAIAENLQPMLDAADGFRAEMERRGWSPTASEHAALAYLLGLMGVAFPGGAR